MSPQVPFDGSITPAMAESVDKQRDRAILRDHLAIQAGEAFLDIGCGDGFLARDVAQALGGDASGVHGLDRKPANIEAARALCPGGTFVTGDAAALPFDTASFDAVSASQVLCFVADLAQAVGEIARVLKPGGRVAVLDTEWETLVWHSEVPAIMARATAHFCTAYADTRVPRRLPALMAEAGLSLRAATCHVILNLTPAEGTYAKLTLGFMAQLMAESDAFTAAEREQLLADQRVQAEAGRFFFSLNRYVLVAEKPVSLL